MTFQLGPALTLTIQEETDDADPRGAYVVLLRGIADMVEEKRIDPPAGLDFVFLKKEDT